MPSSSGIRMSEMTSGVSPMRSRTLERLAAAAGLEAVESLGLEHPDQRPPDRGLVIDDETVGGAGHDRRRVRSIWHV